MNNVLPFAPAGRISSDLGSSLYSDHMLAELLALQEGMIAQLRLERLRIADTADFLTDMVDHFLTGVIDQHEKAAALLRTQLENHPAETPNDGQNCHSEPCEESLLFLSISFPEIPRTARNDKTRDVSPMAC
ncbi:MAG TPA: hypothetical protein VNV15_09310 [Opitutaceae bacterium]|jgi:hypothetical protein|nr:hypothetical protein [Opitutaceae bacterium]